MKASKVPARSNVDAPVIDGAINPDALDKRTRSYKRFAGVLAAFYSDLGGEDGLSEAKKQLVYRLATLAVWCEAQDAAALSGEQIDADQYGRVAGHMRRIIETLGVERVARDITPRLDSYLNNVSGRAASAVEAS